MDEPPEPRRWVPLSLFVAIVSISFAAIFFRLASPTHPLLVAGTRLLIAAAVLALPTLRALLRGRLPSRVRRRALLGGLLYGVHFGTWVTSLTITSVASSVTLVTATPLLLAILSVVTRRDRPSRRHWTSIGLALVGLGFIGWADFGLSADALLGDGLALIGAVAMALYLYLVRGLGRDLDVLGFSGLTTLVGGVSLISAALVFGVPFHYASWSSLGYIALAALLPQLIGHNLMTWSLRHTSPTVVGIATIGEPVGATFLAWVWLGDELAPLVGVGCLITLLAVVISLGRQRTV